MTVLTMRTAEEMEHLGARVAGLLRAGDLVVLAGTLGAGKTTFTRGLGAALGVRGTVTSPTFVLARTHPREEGPPLVHVDAYRLASALELDDLDIDYAGSIVVVEWGDGLLDGVTDSWLRIGIERTTGAAGAVGGGAPAVVDDAAAEELDGDDPRTVTITGTGPRWAGVSLPPS